MPKLPIFVAVILGLLAVRASATDRPGDRSGPWVIHYSGEPHLVSATDSVLKLTRASLQNFLRSDLDFEVDLYIAESEEEFDSLSYYRIPEWSVGVAISELSLIVVKSPSLLSSNATLGYEKTVAHEYAHLALDHRLRGVRPPRWFNEGMAMLVATDWGWQNVLDLTMAGLFGNYVQLEEIEQINRFDRRKASLAYSLSYLAVQYMYEEYGHEQVYVFLDSLAGNASIDNALLGSVGSDYANFDQEFHLYLKSRFNLITLAGDTVYFWLAMALILILGAFLAYRKKRSYYRKWEDEEKLASTDFDYGDPDNPERPDDDEPWRR